ncbi:MAG: hypothetical protein JXQ29_18670 [Planctomycetes bacterium]|nr:hypothetical protein [Planctomycetota bacterium]
MANAVGNYNEDFFAQEALVSLYKHLGLATRVYMGYDREYATHQAGDTIKIRGPGSFTAGNAPTATASAADVTARSATITLDQWKDVVFGLTDKELALSKKQIIEDHVDPAAAAIADAIDQYILSYYYAVPYAFCQAGATAAVTDIVEARRLLQIARCPLGDRANMHAMLTLTHEKDLLNLAAFTQYQGGDGPAVTTQLSGNLGLRYGFNFWANQNYSTHVCTTATDVAGAIDSDPAVGYDKGTSTIHVDAFGASDVLKKGDTFYITGDPQPYSLTADATLSSNEIDINISPPLRQAVLDNAVVTFVAKTPAGHDLPAGAFSLFFHRNWFGLAFGRLPDADLSGLGAKVRSVLDPVTGLGIRVTMWYDGNLAKKMVRVDALYGGVVLEPDMACRMHESA